MQFVICSCGRWYAATLQRCPTCSLISYGAAKPTQAEVERMIMDNFRRDFGDVPDQDAFHDFIARLTR
jgi:hypothetical protein